MTATKGKVIHLYQRDPQEALERLNRITGLRFSSWPHSLASACPCADQADTSGSCETLAQLDPAGTCGPAGMVSG